MRMRGRSAAQIDEVAPGEAGAGVLDAGDALRYRRHLDERVDRGDAVPRGVTLLVPTSSTV